MTAHTPDTEELIVQAARGDASAREGLLARHRERLRKMIAYRLDRRLAARVDPSDVVQDVLIEANEKLDRYMSERPLPFYPWLRRMATERLQFLHRRHVQAAKRSVRHEEPDKLELPDDSLADLAERLVASTTSPSQRLLAQEERQRVQQALEQLAERDREVLVLRHLEQLSVAETAAVLEITQGAVKTRHVRALERIRALLTANDLPGGER
jgi:RNA polymerase sigma-70 factor (ECF subfamily)